MTVGSPPSRTVTTELVVPRSIPTARAMGWTSLIWGAVVVLVSGVEGRHSLRGVRSTFLHSLTADLRAVSRGAVESSPMPSSAGRAIGPSLDVVTAALQRWGDHNKAGVISRGV